MKEVVRVWIGNPYEEGHFNGTAFFIDAQTLVTAKHVVTDREGKLYENIFLGNTPDGGIIPVDEVQFCKRDLAILKVKKSFSVVPKLFTKEMQEGNDVRLIGFYDNDSSQKTYENRISGYQSSEHTYELQNHLTNGLSGCPVFFNGKICGVAKAINIKKNLTYVIPITELCMETESFFKEKKVEKKKLSLEQWSSIAGIGGTVIALFAWLIPLVIEPAPEPTPEFEQPSKRKVAVEMPQVEQVSKQALEGLVTDTENNPLEGVDVWQSKTGTTIQTDEQGHYLFEDIEAEIEEELEVSFSKTGYGDQTQIQQLGEEHNVFLQKEVD